MSHILLIKYSAQQLITENRSQQRIVTHNIKGKPIIYTFESAKKYNNAACQR